MNKYQDRFKVVLFIFFFVALIYLIQLFRIQILNDDYKFSANNNALRYDIHDGLKDKSRDVVVRNGRLYDLVNHTDEFTETLYLDLVTLYAFEDLPNPFQRYITYRAAVRAATQLVSNPQLAQLLKEDEFKNY